MEGHSMMDICFGLRNFSGGVKIMDEDKMKRNNINVTLISEEPFGN
jgi:hypothetical protein